MEIFKEIHFEAAHLLPNVPEGHKCRRLHGHSFKVILYVHAPIDPKLGWVMDFADLKKATQPIVDQVDHRYLNEIPGLENPTSENLARWLWSRFKKAVPDLSRIVVSETCTSGCTYSGEDD